MQQRRRSPVPPFPAVHSRECESLWICRHPPFRILLSASLVAGITPFRPAFHTQMVTTNGTSLYVESVAKSGRGAVAWIRLTGEMWAPCAIVLAKDHTVIVPDLRGWVCPITRIPATTKKNQAVDIAGVMDALKVQKADLVTHDIGNIGRLCVGCSISGPGHALGGDRCTAARNRRLGQHRSQPDAVHFRFPGS